MSTDLYPLKLDPSLHVKVWGGRKLQEKMRKQLPTDEPYGESWELHDTAVIANGPLAGRTLGDVLHEYGDALAGPGSRPEEGFPLLAKLLDAQDWLSVQVHPNDEQARQLEGDPRGKTEAWIVLEAAPGARLVIGVKPGTSREAMAEAIRSGTLEELLVYAPVQAGDVLYMRANTVHALGPGILIYEIQQSSDVTYRLYDWGRMGLDGKPRELHIEKGVQVSNLEELPQVTHPPAGMAVTLVDGEYFRTVRHTLDGDTITLETGDHFHALTCIEGTVTVRDEADRTIELHLGETGLIPASLDGCQITGPGTVLRSFQRPG